MLLHYEYGRALTAGHKYGDAIRSYRVAADQGYAGAQYNLGVMYESGKGIPQDMPRRSSGIARRPIRATLRRRPTSA